jgi:CHAD domain-containing protein
MVAKDHKWYFEIEPDVSMADAARKVLGSRIESVAQYVQRARKENHDVETVHQLRVATRRLAAALTLCKPALPGQWHGRIRRANRRLRRAAGELRDLDVKVPILRERLASSSWLPGELNERVREVVDRLHARAVERFEDDLGVHGRRFVKQARRLESRLGRPSRVTKNGPNQFGNHARHHLSTCWQEFMAAGRMDLTDVEHLHQFRIHGKRFRYALEMAAGCVPREAMEAVYQSLRDLQGQLGHVNDLRNLHSLLARMRPSVLRRFEDPAAQRLAQSYDRLTAAVAFEWFDHHRSFVSRWTAAGRAGLETQVRRLTEPPSGGRDGRGRARSIGFPISGSTVTPIIAKKVE